MFDGIASTPLSLSHLEERSINCSCILPPSSSGIFGSGNCRTRTRSILPSGISSWATKRVVQKMHVAAVFVETPVFFFLPLPPVGGLFVMVGLRRNTRFLILAGTVVDVVDVVIIVVSSLFR